MVRWKAYRFVSHLVGVEILIQGSAVTIQFIDARLDVMRAVGRLHVLARVIVDLVVGQRVAALLQRLRELGWVEGRNLAIEYRWAEARTERCTAGLTRPTNLEAAPSYGRNGVWCSLSCELRMEHSP